MTGWQVGGRAAVAAGGGLAAWGIIEVSALAVGALFGAPVEVPLLVGVVAFVGLEFVYEKTAKHWLYEQFDLYGKNEPR